jgi:hypothetical protein
MGLTGSLGKTILIKLPKNYFRLPPLVMLDGPYWTSRKRGNYSVFMITLSCVNNINLALNMRGCSYEIPG